MWTKKETIIFFSGAATSPSLVHILIPMLITLPTKFGPITLTTTINTYIIIVSALITIALIWWANKLK